MLSTYLRIEITLGGLLFACGWGIALTWIPAVLRLGPKTLPTALFFFCAPLTGGVVWMVLGWILSVHLGLPTNTYSQRLVQILIGINVFLAMWLGFWRREALSLYCRNPARVWISKLIRMVSLALLALIVSSLYFLPNLRFPFLTATALTNNDLPSYAVSEVILQRHSLLRPDPIFDLQPDFPQVIRREVFGAYILTSIASSATGIPIHALENAWIVLFAAFCLGLIWVLGGQMGLEPGWSAMAAFWGLVNPLSAYTIQQGYKSQIMGMAYFLLLMSGAHLRMQIMHSGIKAQCVPFMVLLIVASLGLLFCYPHMLIAVGLLLLLGESITFWHVKESPLLAARRFVRDGSYLFIAMSLCAPLRMWIVLKQFGEMLQRPAGWFQPFLTPLHWLSFSVHYDLFAQRSGILSIAGQILILLGWRRLAQRTDPLGQWSLHLGLLIGTLYVGSALVNTLAEGFGGYKAFKWISFFIPYLVLCFMQPFVFWLKQQSLQYRRLISSWSAVIFIALGFLNANYLVRLCLGLSYPSRSFQFIAPEIMALNRLNDQPEVSGVNLHGWSVWEQMWICHFVDQKPIYFAQPTYYPRSPALLGNRSVRFDQARNQRINPAGERLLERNWRFDLLEVTAGPAASPRGSL